MAQEKSSQVLQLDRWAGEVLRHFDARGRRCSPEIRLNPGVEEGKGVDTATGPTDDS